MSFTDDDLKRLKTMVLNCEAFYAMNTEVLPIRLSNLLARLEAAEKCLNHLHLCGGWDDYPEPDEELDELKREWRKSKGAPE